MKQTVLHVIPAGVFSNTFQGSYKDVISRVRFFERADVEYRQVLLEADDPQMVLESVPTGATPRVLVEYSTLPRTVKALRQRFPSAFIAVRSHNVEPLQHLDNHGWWSRRGPLWMLYGMGRLLAADLVCKRHADVIYSISDWENRVYWNRLPGRARVEWLPYHCPEHLLPEEIPPLSERRVIACLPTSQKNRKSWDLVTRFITFAEEARRLAGDEYEFVLTGRLDNWGLPPTKAVTFTGMVDDLKSFLQTVRAVCMLSPLGYGFKTTIGDAIAHGCTVLAHPALVKRCPTVIQPAMISVETSQGVTIQNALMNLVQFPAGPHLAPDLRSLNLKLLQTHFGGVVHASEKELDLACQVQLPR